VAKAAGALASIGDDSTLVDATSAGYGQIQINEYGGAFQL
jgi:hypothetical protein